MAAVGCSSSDSQPVGGGPGDSNAPGSNGGPGKTGEPQPPSCTESAIAPLSAPANGTLLDIAADADGPWLLVLDTNQRSLSIVRANTSAEKKVLEAASVTTGALAARSDGQVCAAWGVSKPSYSVHYACGPEFNIVDTNVPLQISPDKPLAFHDGPEGGALLFMGKYASLDGMVRDKAGWHDANVQESSISYPGSARALGGSTEGAPFCFVANQSSGPAPVVVESWLRGGTANRWGVLSLPEKTGATSCAVAVSGTTLGVLAWGGGKAAFATAPMTGDYASPLADEPFAAPDIGPATLSADKDGFVVVYGTKTGAVRAAKKAGGAWESKPLGVPAGKSVERVAIARENGREHIALSVDGATYYQRSCGAP